MLALDEAFSSAERVRINALKASIILKSLRQDEVSPVEGALTQQLGLKRPRDAIVTESIQRKEANIMATAVSIYKGSEDDQQRERKNVERDFTLKRHQPWAMKKVLPGHDGWVRCIGVDPSNEWVATGSVDTVIKVWDLATGQLKQNLTGHKEAVRGLAISPNRPYMFSASDDRSVKCWDLESNRIIHDYHGHNGSVNTISVHPELDVIVSGSRDKCVKLWDMRSRRCIHSLQGHKEAVTSVISQKSEPQIMSGGADSLIYLWDIRTGRPITNLTRHKKPVEALIAHKTEETFVSVGSDNVRKWKLPLGVFYTNMHHDTVPGAQAEGPWCCGALSPWGELFVGGRDGTLRFYDWTSNILLQQSTTKGFNKGEKGILCCAFDASGKRLITGEVDKTVKIWEPKSTST